MPIRASAIVLILANLTPLAGVLFLEWRVLDVLLLYWTESVVIGLVNVLRMGASRAGNPLAGMASGARQAAIARQLDAVMPRRAVTAMKFVLIPFFVLHYGGFCYGHLMAVIGLFTDGGLSGGLAGTVTAFWEPAYWVPVLSIAISHLYSFAANYIGRGEYLQTSLFTLMHRPYGRIIAMHIAIIAGGGLVMWLGNPVPMLVVLIAVKTSIDLRLHESERRKLAGAS